MWGLLDCTLLRLAHKIVRDLGVACKGRLFGDVVNMYVYCVVVVHLAAAW